MPSLGFVPGIESGDFICKKKGNITDMYLLFGVNSIALELFSCYFLLQEIASSPITQFLSLEKEYLNNFFIDILNFNATTFNATILLYQSVIFPSFPGIKQSICFDRYTLPNSWPGDNWECCSKIAGKP